jgi:biopolymer transport protein ExbD
MPVHSAGPRLYSSIKFNHLVRKAGSGSAPRSSNISLNLVPFVDMMTMLVCFLLMVFSTTGELLSAQKGLELPTAEAKVVLQRAPVIIVTRTEITYQGGLIATVESVLRDESPTYRIEALYERLEAAARKIKEDVLAGKVDDKKLLESCEKQRKRIRPEPGMLCPDGLAILQADKETDARLINKIVVTAKAAGFDNLLFAVENK